MPSACHLCPAAAVTLIAVSGATLSVVRAVEATELIACDIFNTGGRQITLGDVQRYLCELRSHASECRCGRCQAAAIVRADRVLMVVRVWQRQLAATRVRALR